ncbi:MAG TPA: hypothetical protein VGG64_16345 [Pirellulales bacterium]
MPTITPTYRRWFQFGIGEILVVVAILAWGLACRPYATSRRGAGTNYSD